MIKISQYETIHDFWADLQDMSDALAFRSSHKHPLQERVRLTTPGLDVQLMRRSGLGPTCLRVSLDRVGNNDVTKLDFDQKPTGYDTWHTVGHLLLPPPPHQKPKGIEVIRLSGLADRFAPALDALDSGVTLLESRAQLEANVSLWKIGTRIPES